MDKFEEWMSLAADAAATGDLDRATVFRQLAETYAHYRDTDTIANVVSAAVTMEVADAVQRLTKTGWDDGVEALRTKVEDLTDQVGRVEYDARVANHNAASAIHIATSAEEAEKGSKRAGQGTP